MSEITDGSRMAYRLFRKARLCTRPTPARQDAPFRGQGRSERRGGSVLCAVR